MNISKLALVAALSETARSQLLAQFFNPDQIVEKDFQEVDAIDFNGSNIGMSVYYGTIDYSWASRGDYSSVTQLDIGSFLLGNLRDNSYYQTYF